MAATLEANVQAPAGAAMSAMERAAWMQASILQAVKSTMGRTVGLEEPLMTAGLDSLGKYDHSLGDTATSANLSILHMFCSPRAASRPCSRHEGHSC